MKKIIKILLIFLLIYINILYINIFSDDLSLPSKEDIKKIESVVKDLLRGLVSSGNSPGQIYVRKGSELPDLENKVVETRLNNNQTAINKLFNINNKKKLNIAICGSGGGVRAMTWTLGALLGLDNIGILNCVTYMSALSGSTWVLAPLISMPGNISENLKFLQALFAKNLTKNSKNPPFFQTPNQQDIQQIVKILVTKYIFDQPITSIDLWGLLIINNLLDGFTSKYNLTLSKQQKRLDGNCILPIYTAIAPMPNGNYEWYEFTPFEVGNGYLNFWVSSNGFGSIFNNSVPKKFDSSIYEIDITKILSGKTILSTSYAPEQNIGFLMGIWGSAFTASPEDLIKIIDFKKAIQDFIANNIKNTNIKTITNLILNNSDVINNIVTSIINDLLDKDLTKKSLDIYNKYKNKRVSPAEINNFTYNIPVSPIKNENIITLVDAGIDYNLPLPPLLRRNVDIIIVFDASGDILNDPTKSELGKAEQYAKNKNYNFPKIDYNNINKKSITIFGESTYPITPIIIYLPRIKGDDLVYSNSLKSFDPEACTSSGYCSTFNFKYTPEEFSQLLNLAKFNIIQNKNKILNVLKNALDKKK